MSLFKCKSEGLDVNFCKTLGATHDVGWIHCFVCRDHHHLFHIIFNALVCYVLRSSDIDLYCFAWIFFHERNVFVGCCVEDYLRAPLEENIVKPLQLSYVTDDRYEICLREFLFKFEAEVVHRGLCVVEEDQFSRSEPCKLTAELRSYGACCSCDKDSLSCEIFLYFLHRDLDLRSHQEVFDLDVTH